MFSFQYTEGKWYKKEKTGHTSEDGIPCRNQEVRIMKFFRKITGRTDDILQVLRDRKKRIFISLLAGAAGAVLAAGGFTIPVGTGAAAWWGTMYPEFCFSDSGDREEDGDGAENNRPRISFWLAKALDW